jgi:toluene monooxygenase system protein E
MTISTDRSKRKRSATWSLLGDQRRKPSEYEVVSHGLNYHFRREPTPFELDPRAPLNVWYLKNREQSPFQVESWDEWRDPSKLTYRSYVEGQKAREVFIDTLIEGYEARDGFAALDSAWVRTLDRLYTPSRYAGHILQMMSVYVSQMAPSSYQTIAYHFQGGDEMRRVQRNAYVTKALSIDHLPQIADSAHTRSTWERDEAWQPMRELLEKALIAYDWGEAFTVLSLVAKPAVDAIFNEQLGFLARSNNDEILAALAAEFTRDEDRHRATASSLLTYAIDQRPELRDTVGEWVQKWQPLADNAIAGLSELFASAPVPADASTVRAEATERSHSIAVECGVA